MTRPVRTLAIAANGGRFLPDNIKVGWQVTQPEPGYVMWWGVTKDDESLKSLLADIRKTEGDFAVLDRRPLTAKEWNEEAVARENPEGAT